jgi:predicted transcriptional regulator
MLDREIDIAIKLAQAINMLNSQPKASPDLKIFLIIHEVSPYELSVDDIERITGLNRKQVGDALNILRGWGWVTEKGGQLSASK